MANLCGLGFHVIDVVYIMRWTNEYKQNGGMNLFDDAYVDVVKPPHFGLSSQLLTWVVLYNC